MNLVTSTELRTKIPHVINLLANGESVDLIHRSRIVGEIRPKKNTLSKVINSKLLQKKIDKLGLPSLTAKEIDRRYRIAMTKKHGQGIS